MQHPTQILKFTSLWILQLVCAINLRNDTFQVHVGTAKVVSNQPRAVGTFLAHLSIPRCSLPVEAPTLLAQRSKRYHAESLVEHTTKLRVCNAATTARTASLSVWANGKKLNSEAIAQRACVEFNVPITHTTKFVIQLSGEVLSEWSTEKLKSEMIQIPVLFFVGYVFGQDQATTFTVNEFHGEDTGLNSVQVAYMDIFRGAPAADLQLISPGGSFQMRGGTFVHICAGEYTLRFVQNSHAPPSSDISGDTSLVAISGEQYVVLRIAPENAASQNTSGNIARQAVLTFPKSGASPQARLTGLAIVMMAARILT